MNLNKIILIGRVGRDAEIHISKTSLKKFAVLSLATSETWKDKVSGEFKTDTQWHTVKVFNERIVEKVEKTAKKGALVYIEGKIKYRKYQDKNGIEKTGTDIEIDPFSGSFISLEKTKDASSKDLSGGDFLDDIII